MVPTRGTPDNAAMTAWGCNATGEVDDPTIRADEDITEVALLNGA